MEIRVRLKHRRLAEEIRSRGLSQNRWAQKLGINRGHLSQLLQGKRPYPEVETRARLLEGLNLSFDDIFEYEVSGPEARPPVHPVAELPTLFRADDRIPGKAEAIVR